MKKYIIRLTNEERCYLTEVINKGKGAAYKIKHANIMLKADADGTGWTGEQIAKAFSVHWNTVRNVRQRFVEQGLEAALNRKKLEGPFYQQIIDGCWFRSIRPPISLQTGHPVGPIRTPLAGGAALGYN